MPRPNFTALRTAPLLSTGSTPGMPRSISEAWVLGSAPKVVAEPEKILDWVLSWTWISRPMTTSQVMFASSLECRRQTAVPVCYLLVAMRHIKQAAFAPEIADQLQAYRQVLFKTGRQAHAGQAGQIGGDGVDVG